MKSKYLFLDFDGCLNHADWYKKLHDKNSPYFNLTYPISEFDPECVNRVNNILDKTGATLVISSSWRMDDYLYVIMKQVGLPEKFDCTPYCYIDEYWDDEGYHGFKNLCRGEEIARYLKDKENYNYCIIDDIEDFYDYQMEYFLKCYEYKGGLTDDIMDKAIEILNR